MKRRPLVILLLAALIVVAIAVGVIASITRSGFSTHEEPTAIEATIARRMRSWAVPADLRDAKNPVPLTPAVLAEARAHFADHCATCHGNDGKGSELGRSMYPETPDMTKPATQSLSDGALFSVIENGVRLTGMPGFGTGTAESAYGSWTLVHFVRHLPKVTQAELAEMERLNPKTPAQWRQMMTADGDATPPPAAAHHH